jgi:hypothetical protein
MRIFVQIFAFFISGLFVSSCFEDPDCIDLRNDFVGFTFKKMFDGKIDTVNVIGISVSGTNDVFYSFTSVRGSIQVPLNVSASTQQFGIDLLRGSYTMVVDYNSEPQFESVDCGPRYILSDLRVSQHNFDSVRVASTVPLAGLSGSNIDIYRCPITNNFKLSFRQLLADEKENGIELKESLKQVSLNYLPGVFYVDTLLSAIVVPLNNNASSTNITIDAKASALTTLNINYSIQPSQLFEVCGIQKFIHDIQVNANSSYDIVRVQKDSIADPPTTNVALFRCPETNLIELTLIGLPGSVDNNYQVNKVTAGYTAELFYQDSLTAKLVLPLDVSQDQTDFTIDFATGPKQISFGYLRTSKTFHGQCNQTLISSVNVLSTDFTAAPVLKKDSIQFPTVPNFEITNN